MANVIYITTACDFNCDYCYERKNRNQLERNKSISYKEIDNFLANLQEPPEIQSQIVIFGGEPFLFPSKVEYIIKNAKNFKDNVYPEITTNGLWLSNKNHTKKIKELMDKYGQFGLEISFDVSGQYRRLLKNGQRSEKYVIQAINNLEDFNVPYSIRYTIHKGNIENVIHDIISILVQFPKCNKIITSIYEEELDIYFGDNNITKKRLEQIKEYLRRVYEKFHVPVCDFTCNLCKKCSKYLYTANRYYVPQKGKIEVEIGKQKEFDHFI